MKQFHINSNNANKHSTQLKQTNFKTFLHFITNSYFKRSMQTAYFLNTAKLNYTEKSFKLQQYTLVVVLCSSNACTWCKNSRSFVMSVLADYDITSPK